MIQNKKFHATSSIAQFNTSIQPHRLAIFAVEPSPPDLATSTFLSQYHKP